MGKGRVQDGDKALALHTLAAEYDYGPALNALGLIYSEPSNEVFNLTQSRDFYERAYELGDYYAPFNLARSYNYYVNYGETNKALSLYPENIGADILKARYWYSKAIEIENYEGIYEYAETFSNEGDFASAKNIILKGIEIAEATDPQDIGMKAHLFSFLSHFYEIQGYDEEALRVMKLAVEAVKNSNVFEPTHIAMTYRDYGATLNKNGFGDEALVYYKKSEEILREANEFELLSPTLNGKAIVLEDMERYEEAVKNYNLAFEMIKDFEGDIDSDLGLIHANVVHSLLQLDRLEEALFHAKKAVEISAIINKGHPWHMKMVSDLARVHEKLENFDAAQRTYSFATELFTQRYFSMRASDIDIFRFGEYNQSSHTINSAAEFFYRTYNRTNNSKYLNKAFVTYQQSRITNAEFEMARLSNRLKISSDKKLEQLRIYQSLSDQIDDLKWLLLQEAIFESKNQISITTLKNDIHSLENEKSELNIHLESENVHSVFNDRFLALEETQVRLTDDQLLVFPAETFSDAPITVFFNFEQKNSHITYEDVCI